PEGATPPYCGPQSSYNRHDEFWARWSALLRLLVTDAARSPGGDPSTLAALPAPPFVQRTRSQVVVRLAQPPAPPTVRLALSEDGGFTFESHELHLDPRDGAYHLRKDTSSSVVLIAEVSASEGLCASSIPTLPHAFKPRVRPFGPQPTTP